MSIHLTITAESSEEFLNKLRFVAAGLSADVAVRTPMIEALVNADEVKFPEPVEATTKRTRKPKDTAPVEIEGEKVESNVVELKPAAALVIPDAEVAEALKEETIVIETATLGVTIEAPVSSLTIDDARAAMRGVLGTHGPAGAEQLLARFDVKKVSDVPVEKYGEFIETAKNWGK